ncbi:MAG: MmcQ/YjbR family DNA-binding protein [Bacteroidales bacterium]|nr:MmcQ/YjbR family DNA-binding protein [Bacteroidales bacterium]
MPRPDEVTAIAATFWHFCRFGSVVMEPHNSFTSTTNLLKSCPPCVNRNWGTGSYNLKVDPDFSLDLQERYPCIRPGYHMNKRHWISVDLNSAIPAEVEQSIIRHAYNRTAMGLTKKLRGELGFD